MRVTHEDIDELIKDLRQEADAGAIYKNIVRMRTYRMAENDHGTCYTMGLWVTALIRHEDGDWCVEFGEAAPEQDTQKNPDGGTNIVNEWRDKVHKLCDEFGLQVRSGKFEVY